MANPESVTFIGHGLAPVHDSAVQSSLQHILTIDVDYNCFCIRIVGHSDMCPFVCRNNQTLIGHIAAICSHLQLVLRNSGITDAEQELTFDTHNGSQHLVKLAYTNQRFCRQLIHIIGYIWIGPSYVNQILGNIRNRINQCGTLQHVVHGTGALQDSDACLVYRNRQYIYLLTVQLRQVLEADSDVV